MAVVVRVRFRPTGGLYDYDASALPQVQRGDFVVVPTQFGPQVGEVMQVVTAADPAQAEPSPQAEDAPALEPVLRRASARDLALRRLRQGKEVELLVNLRARLKDLAQKDRRARSVRIVEVELSLDDRQVRVLYTDSEEERGLSGNLRKALQRLVGPRQTHWVRLGPRDAAKIMGGVGACGMPQRCCSLFMTTFQSVSVRMAKVQSVSLSPSEIAGMCGRLRCCLRFEHEQYAQARAHLPRERKRVRTPEGEGRVVAVHPLAGQVTVDIPEKGRLVFAGDEVQLLNAASAAPCADCPAASPGSEGG
ncbi:MAG: hypothetical protein GXO37_04635 [Chloroflexi bacterium]|nr:hypothetical protein [Chloroflexota bacterium]